MVWPWIPGCAISIHAPRVGSDTPLLRVSGLYNHFNPRSPCGERQINLAPRIMRGDFNPRSPCGERPKHDKMIMRPMGLNFNPRSPCGERHASDFRRHCSIYFNPRSPCGERHTPLPTLFRGLWISIHAPRVGSDKLLLIFISRFLHFNPRSPCGERPKAIANPAAAFIFQSTLPVWGATEMVIG